MAEIPFSEIFRKGFDEFRKYVNPLIAERASLAKEPIEIVGTENGLLVDSEGNRLENFHGTQFFGHRSREIESALRQYLDSSYPEWFPTRVSPLAGRLGRELCKRSGYSQVFFGLSGSDGVEASLKLTRAATRTPGILCLERSYHGCNYGSTALMAPGLLHDPFGPHLPGVQMLPFNDSDALKKALEKGDIGCVVVEPIQGEGGVRPLSEEYIAALCELTKKHGSLLIADEIQTGLGKTGRFLMTSNWPRRPDVVVIAKQLGGGLMPISAILTEMEIYRQAYGKHFGTAEAHNMTFSYNSLGMVAGLATLDLLSDELMEEVKTKGAWFKSILKEALQGAPLVEEVRGEGLMLGIKLKNFTNPWVSFEHFGFRDLENRPTVSPLLARRLYKHHFFCFTCGHDWSVFRLQPRFDIEREKLSNFVRVLREEIDYLGELD